MSQVAAAVFVAAFVYFLLSLSCACQHIFGANRCRRFAMLAEKLVILCCRVLTSRLFAQALSLQTQRTIGQV